MNWISSMCPCILCGTQHIVEALAVLSRAGLASASLAPFAQTTCCGVCVMCSTLHFEDFSIGERPCKLLRILFCGLCAFVAYRTGNCIEPRCIFQSIMYMILYMSSINCMCSGIPSYMHMHIHVCLAHSLPRAEHTPRGPGPPTVASSALFHVVTWHVPRR